MPWTGFSSPEVFSSACNTFCSKTSEDARSQIVATPPPSPASSLSSSSYVGICTCYGEWPHSPLTIDDLVSASAVTAGTNTFAPLFPSLLDPIDGRIKGCPPPVQRYTYQSK